jgi:hypothetical protein
MVRGPAECFQRSRLIYMTLLLLYIQCFLVSSNLEDLSKPKSRNLSALLLEIMDKLNNIIQHFCLTVIDNL